MARKDRAVPLAEMDVAPVEIEPVIDDEDEAAARALVRGFIPWAVPGVAVRERRGTS